MSTRLLFTKIRLDFKRVWLFRCSSSGAIVLFRAPKNSNKFERNSVKFNVKTSREFAMKNFHCLVGQRTPETVQYYKPSFVIAYNAINTAKGAGYFRKPMLKIAKEYKSIKGDFQHELNECGFKYTGDKPVILAKDDANQKFITKFEFSIDNLSTFLSDSNMGESKSQPIPLSNDGPVKVAVGKNFADVVMNNGKDTLIEFYAPWCQHCKKFAPIYRQLAEKLINEDLSIIKCDATANDLPKMFDVSNFPVLYWLPKNSKNNPEQYAGDRGLDDLIKYISKKATNELKGFDRNGNAKNTY